MEDIMNSIILIFVMLFALRMIIIKKRAGGVRREAANHKTDFKPQAGQIDKVAPERPKSTGVADNLRGGTKGSVGTKKSQMTAQMTMEDRSHDWLARQLNEEQLAKRRMSEMFGFKDLHSSNCDARKIRDEHTANCDAHGIDTATK